MIWGPFGPI